MIKNIVIAVAIIFSINNFAANSTEFIEKEYSFTLSSETNERKSNKKEKDIYGHAADLVAGEALLLGMSIWASKAPEGYSAYIIIMTPIALAFGGADDLYGSIAAGLFLVGNGIYINSIKDKSHSDIVISNMVYWNLGILSSYLFFTKKQNEKNESKKSDFNFSVLPSPDNSTPMVFARWKYSF